MKDEKIDMWEESEDKRGRGRCLYLIHKRSWRGCSSIAPLPVWKSQQTLEHDTSRLRDICNTQRTDDGEAEFHHGR